MRRLLVLVALVLAASVGTAQATTIIDFEDLTRDPTFVPVPGDKISDGFLFDSSSDHLHVDGGATPIWNTTKGTTFLVEDGPSITVSPIAGGPFTLRSMDISEAHEFARAHQVLVSGIRFGGGINPAPLTLSLDAFSTNPPGPNGFQTFTFGSDWENLASITLLGTGDLLAYWALDNIVVADAVPEPATLTLLGLGSAYLIRRRRRIR